MVFLYLVEAAGISRVAASDTEAGEKASMRSFRKAGLSEGEGDGIAASHSNARAVIAENYEQRLSRSECPRGLVIYL